MKVALIFPPFVVAYQPYSSVPTLAGFLRAKGCQTELLDANLEFLTVNLRPESMRLLEEEAAAWIRGEFSGDVGAAERSALKAHANRVLRGALSHRFSRGIEEAVGMLREEATLRSSAKANQARDLVQAAQNFLHHYAEMDRFIRNGGLRGPEPPTWDELLQEVRVERRYARFCAQVVRPWLDVRSPDLIGISVVFEEQLIPALAFASVLRRSPRRTPLVLGGPALTVLKEKICQDGRLFDFCDFVAVHEGEPALEGLIGHLSGRTPRDRIPNVLYRDGSRVRVNPMEVVENLDALPPPSYDGLPLDRYLTPRLVPILKPTRGCYWGRCAFCNTSYLNNGTRYRSRAPERVLEDMRTLERRSGATCFEIWDEASPPRFLRQFSRLLVDRGSPYRWSCELRLDRSFTRELCSLMHDAGCRAVVFGLESGSQRMQDRMHKGYRLEVCRQVIRNAAQAGLRVYLTLMVGFPGERPRDVFETMELVEQQRRCIGHAGVSLFHLRDFTPVHKRAPEFGVSLAPWRTSTVAPGGDLGYTCRHGMRLPQAVQLYEVVRQRLHEMGLAGTEPICHYLLRTSDRAMEGGRWRNRGAERSVGA
ncbi:B12-binding domain-containing radical SAM protein [Deferrisoma sp.]